MHHILHHANCADGFAAACIARHALLTQGVPHTDINVQPVNYGWPDQMPLGKNGILFPGDTVTYLDYTPPQETLDAFYAEHGQDAISLTIIDHHAKAAVIHGRSTDTGLHLADLPPPRFNSWFNLNHSGASITWTAFCQQTQHSQSGQCSPTPRAIELISWRDCGHAFDPANADDPRTRDALALHAYLFRCLPRTFDAWKPLLIDDASLILCLATGARLLSIDKSIILSAAANPHWLDFKGEQVPAVNGLAAGLVSDACTALLAAYPSAPFAASWYIDDASGNAVYSLRSRRGSPVNVSDIAASMAPGGGGHPNAAGFSTPIPIPFV